MRFYHGMHKNNGYFEGWYFKLQNEKETIAFIPGINITKKGEKSAFIQIITQRNSFHIPYSFEDFHADSKKLFIQIGKNIFSDHKIQLQLNDKEVNCSGEILLNRLTPVKNDVMGYFRWVPFMECNHGIISSSHAITGKLSFQNNSMNFDNGIGYIETDWGSSFPKSYLWIQSNQFAQPCSIMASVAKIPLMGKYFTGCICIVHYQNKEYRFATYHGVKILECTDKTLILKQGNMQLSIKAAPNCPQKLYAPLRGEMSREIYEDLSCYAEFKLTINNQTIFHMGSKGTSYEYVPN